MENERWDWYPCQVDDAPASIDLSMKWVDVAPPSDYTTMYAVRFRMVDASEHGMGADAEAEALWPAQEDLEARAAALELVYVGRLRSNGHWQITLYGPEGQGEALSAAASEVGRDAGRTVQTMSDVDPDWSYYHSFLVPGNERRHWMQDRDTVEALAEHGDHHERVRPVDHEVEFPSQEAAEVFLQTAQLRGYRCTERNGQRAEEGVPSGPFHFVVQRDDPVELEHIHRVVMDVDELAAPYDGRHVGWGCPVESE